MGLFKNFVYNNKAELSQIRGCWVEDSKENRKLVAWMPFVFVLCFAPAISDKCKNNEYIRHYANECFGQLIKPTVLQFLLSTLLSILGLICGVFGSVGKVLAIICLLLDLITTIILSIIRLVIMIKTEVAIWCGDKYTSIFHWDYF